jgi:alkylhydroperoxidase family enzyme
VTDVETCALPHPRLPLAELPPEAANSGITSLLGQFGHAPGLIESWLAWYSPIMLADGRIPVRTKELCRLAVAARTGCHMCQNGRFPDPAGVGPAAPPEDADAVLAGDFSRFSEAERAALDYTIAFWNDHKTIPDDVIARATDALGYDGFIELALMVAQWMGMGRLFSALGIQYG